MPSGTVEKRVLSVHQLQGERKGRGKGKGNVPLSHVKKQKTQQGKVIARVIDQKKSIKEKEFRRVKQGVKTKKELTWGRGRQMDAQSKKAHTKGGRKKIAQNGTTRRRPVWNMEAKPGKRRARNQMQRGKKKKSIKKDG